MLENPIVEQLGKIVGEEQVLQDPKSLEDYGWDAFSYMRVPSGEIVREAPLAVVRPATTEEVSEVLQLATRTKTPVVPYGSGTGVMGGAASVEPGIVLDVSRMNRIGEVSLEDWTAVVQPGVVLGDLDDWLRPQSLFLAHDPWSRPIASVGGAISTNGVGYLAAKYGPMGRQVLGLEVVLPTGEVVRTRALPQALSAGVDLTHLFIGAEGTLGVITEATIQVYPIPDERRHYAIHFPSFPNGFFAIEQMLLADMHPVMVDFSEEDRSEAGGSAIVADGPCPSFLHLSLEGTGQDVGIQEDIAWQICEAYGGRDMGPEEAQRFWERRHESAERYRERQAQGQRRPWQPGERAWDYLHVALPASRILDFRYQAVLHYAKEGIRVRECAIWGEPEMFSLTVYDTLGGSDSWERMREASDHVLKMGQDMGGTLEYCHGVGLRLAHLMRRELGAGGTFLLGRVKAALDPAGIMNPGKLLA